MLITLHSFIISFYQFLSVWFCCTLNDFLGVCRCRISALTSRRLNAADSDIHTIYRRKFFQVRSSGQSSVFLKVPEFPSLSETKVELSRVDFYYKSLGCIITKVERNYNLLLVFSLWVAAISRNWQQTDRRMVRTDRTLQRKHASYHVVTILHGKGHLWGTIDNTCDGRRSTDELDYAAYYSEWPPMYTVKQKKGTNFLLRASFLILDRNW